MKARFAIGDKFEFPGARFEIILGEKKPKGGNGQDLVLTLNGRQNKVPMEMAGMMVEFFFHNEETLYPPFADYEGGKKFLTYGYNCVKMGYPDATRRLELEKANKDRNLELDF
jgi:hypothetical protein